MILPANRRVLIVDDMPSIHEDFKRILGGASGSQELSSLETMLFGTPVRPAGVCFQLDSAYQGREALDKVHRSVDENRPYALAIVDMRMPPGWDGVETAEHLWQADPHLLIAMCTAYFDFSWEQVLQRLGEPERIRFFTKPFDPPKVLALVESLVALWTPSSNPGAA